MNIFEKLYNTKTLYAPVNGTIVNIELVNDKLFSKKIIGNGLAIIPSDGNILAPCNGTVKYVLSEKHAIFISTTDGTEVLIHLGLDTFEMNGDGFDCFVTNNQKIKIGDLLIKMDLYKIKQLGKDSIVTTVMTKNSEKEIIKKNRGNCIAGKTKLLTYLLK